MSMPGMKSGGSSAQPDPSAPTNEKSTMGKALGGFSGLAGSLGKALGQGTGQMSPVPLPNSPTVAPQSEETYRKWQQPL